MAMAAVRMAAGAVMASAGSVGVRQTAVGGVRLAPVVLARLPQLQQRQQLHQNGPARSIFDKLFGSKEQPATSPTPAAAKGQPARPDLDTDALARASQAVSDAAVVEEPERLPVQPEEVEPIVLALVAEYFPGQDSSDLTQLTFTDLQHKFEVLSELEQRVNIPIRDQELGFLNNMQAVNDYFSLPHSILFPPDERELFPELDMSTLPANLTVDLPRPRAQAFHSPFKAAL
ncbi:uncharacterized protein MONBRDRAFT_33618 [Monosiga brevicollis MX1]|uniref:Uncharacterized protein n=1 Tax=Monosiga brevicollis TaxID=81824 RepID=A9V6K9_MONBE|nr:uncharacterized protein MONBRDRAFT_33618 [Monosiga brevicollis MX1]EDQ86751.1 predicted protein [Monosiga brevicollis MX1]|eukprot:XP_001748296.1 hypothetical protein [Monosiga brevicollis MX1]